MAEGSKYGPYSKLFFFVMEQDPYEKSGEITSTSIEKYEYTPILKQNSVLSRLRECVFVQQSSLCGVLTKETAALPEFQVWAKVVMMIWLGR